MSETTRKMCGERKKSRPAGRLTDTRRWPKSLRLATGPVEVEQALLGCVQGVREVDEHEREGFKALVGNVRAVGHVAGNLAKAIKRKANLTDRVERIDGFRERLEELGVSVDD